MRSYVKYVPLNSLCTECITNVNGYDISKVVQWPDAVFSLLVRSVVVGVKEHGAAIIKDALSCKERVESLRSQQYIEA